MDDLLTLRRPITTQQPAPSIAPACGSLKISLIVCTRDRGARLPDFFAHLSELEFPREDWELILVDHASTDETPALIEAFAAHAPFEVRPMRVTSPSLACAKNEALAVARGAIIAFTDDDCYPRPDYLQALVQVFFENLVGVVGGRVVLHDPSDAKLSVRDVDTASTIEPTSFVQAGVIHGANLAVSREVVRAIGGFDPLFGPGTACAAAEDIEYVARAVWAGWRARYDPRPVVAHHHGRKPGRDTERYRRTYDYGRGAYYTKFLLHARARNVYLRQWIALARHATAKTARRRLVREVAGGCRYLLQRAIHREPIPRFPAIGA